MKKEILQGLKITILGLIVCLSIGFAFATNTTWNFPTSQAGTPTSGPVNNSTSAQVKNGNLAVDPFFATENAWFYTKLIVGTYTPPVIPGEEGNGGSQQVFNYKGINNSLSFLNKTFNIKKVLADLVDPISPEGIGCNPACTTGFYCYFTTCIPNPSGCDLLNCPSDTHCEIVPNLGAQCIPNLAQGGIFGEIFGGTDTDEYVLDVAGTERAQNMKLSSLVNNSNKEVCVDVLGKLILCPAIPGACGPADSVPASSAPDDMYGSLCSQGNASLVTSDGSSWHWTCFGINGGIDAPCEAPVPVNCDQPNFNFTTPGSSSYTIHAGCGGNYKIEARGGGGQGGGGALDSLTNTGGQGGGGGGMGGYSYLETNLTAGQTISFHVGAGGNRGFDNGAACGDGVTSGDYGGSGEATTVLTLSAPGGQGGFGGTDGSYYLYGQGGSGGAGSCNPNSCQNSGCGNGYNGDTRADGHGGNGGNGGGSSCYDGVLINGGAYGEESNGTGGDNGNLGTGGQGGGGGGGGDRGSGGGCNSGAGGGVGGNGYIKFTKL
ncbi:MAG: hypothetical protein WDK96_01140 [Candidatus Paceibacterota bacterium]